jgi:hypothetical protein
MGLHSVSEELLPSWIDWSRVMGEAFNEEECCAKWQTFSGDREGGLGHWLSDPSRQGVRLPASNPSARDPLISTAPLVELSSSPPR